MHGEQLRRENFKLNFLALQESAVNSAADVNFFFSTIYLCLESDLTYSESASTKLT
jgi:hypothetical protein